MICAASLILISTGTTLLDMTNTTTQTVFAVKKKKIKKAKAKKTKSKKTKTKKAKSLEKEVFDNEKQTLYHGYKTYSGPKPNPQLEKILKKIAKNAHDDDDDGFNVYFKAKRDTTCYNDKTDYDDYDDNGDPVKPNQLGTYPIKKGTILNLYNPYLQLTDEPFLGRDLFKNKVILVGTDDELGYEEYYYYMDDFEVLKEDEK